MLIVDVLTTASLVGVVLFAIFLYIVYDDDDYNNPPLNGVIA